MARNLILYTMLGALLNLCACSVQTNQPARTARIENARATHVNGSIKNKKIYAATNSVHKSGVIKPYIPDNTSPVSTPSVQTVGVVDSSDTYQVKPGDTLYSIAFRYGKDYRQLAAENDIDAPYSICVGQTIFLKGQKAKKATPYSEKQPVAVSSLAKNKKSYDLKQDKYYIVKSGDTAVSVSKKHGLKLSELVSLNKLKKPYSLYKGQKLKVSSSDLLADNGKKTVPVKKTKEVQSVVPVAGREEIVTTDAMTSASIVKTNKVEIVKGRSKKVKSIDWMWPCKGRVIANFSSANKGIDISGSRGQSVNAAAAGQVVYSGNALRGYGNLVIINHNNEFLSAYAHNDMLLVKEGDKVKKGQVIAKMGSTDTDSVKLHFEIRYKGNSVNPRNYLP
ncbi:peptidoglycan DD-metalloendopeptidase family protein [Succinivibrio sp.]|uniref:peptidoglycan DD-metalloendopeptidase family protein n=3 Tax=Succinivibrio sp. TaxID=2053619 RepID=UPI00386BA8A4